MTIDGNEAGAWKPYAVPDSESLEFGGPFTAEAWVRPEQLGGRLWDKITPGSGDGWLLDLHRGLRVIAGQQSFQADRAPQPGEWSHVACVVEPEKGVVRIYLDGQPCGGTPLGQDSKQLATWAAWTTVINAMYSHDLAVTRR